MVRRRVRLFVVCVVSFAWAASAPAEEPLQGMMLPGEKVEVLLSAVGDTRTLGVPGVEGALLSVSVKAARGSKAQPELTAIAPNGAPFDAGDAYSASGARAAYKKLRLPSTGLWRVGIRTPASTGGVVAVATKVKCPSKYVLPGATTGDPASSDVTFPAIPHSTVTVGVRALGRPKWTPSVELIAPSGRSLGTVAGKGAKATLAKIEIAELGDHRVRVTGGPGAFKVTVAVKPPRPRVVTWRDVEAVPEVWAIRPTQTTNDVDLDLFFDGVGFSTQQSVSLVLDGATQRAKTLDQGTPTLGYVQMPLADLPAGDYRVILSTASGASVTAPGTLSVTNREPIVISVFPPEAPWASTIALDVRGGGFDAGCTVEARGVGGTSVPATVRTRADHKFLGVDLRPSPYDVGPKDIAVRDPSGVLGAVKGAVDIVGFRRAPTAVSTYYGGTWESYPRDAAWNADDGTVLIGIQDGKAAKFVLIDPDDMSVLDSLTIPSAVSGGWSWSPRVAWNAYDGTWALAWVDWPTSSDLAPFRAVEGDDLHATRIDQQHGASADTTQVHAACNPANGDWVVTWDEWDSGKPGDCMVAVVHSDGTRDASKVVASSADGFIWTPVIAPMGNGNYVIAYRGTSANDTFWAMRRVVVESDGDPLTFPEVAASEPEWQNAFQPELALNPLDGNMLLAFSYMDQGVYHPAFVRLTGPDAMGGDVESLDDDGLLPAGYIDSLVWNPTRNEFVIALSLEPAQVVVRRVRPDGRLKPTYTPLSYEGVWGILWSGPEADQLGLVRAFDGLIDDYHDWYAPMQTHGAPLR